MVRVVIRDVGHVIAVLLQPECDGEFPEKKFARAGRERRVKNLAVLAVRPVAAHLDAATPIPLLPAVVVERELRWPAVVSLPGVIAALENEIGLAVVTHDEH